MLWFRDLNLLCSCYSTANEGPVRIQYKYMVPIYVFPEMKLLFTKHNYNDLSPSSYSHISVRDIYIFPRLICLFCWRKYVDRSWEYINRSQTHECENWDWGSAIPRKGIHKWDFPCSEGISKHFWKKFKKKSINVCFPVQLFLRCIYFP